MRANNKEGCVRRHLREACNDLLKQERKRPSPKVYMMEMRTLKCIRRHGMEFATKRIRNIC